MSSAPPPKASPRVPGDDPDVTDTPSGSHNIATIREALAIADAAAEPVARSTKLQWIGLGFLGAVTLGVGGFLSWCLITMGVIGQAQAQTKAKAEQALEATKSLGLHLESVDAGTRAALERFEKKMDDREERAQRERETQNAKIDAQTAMLRQLVVEVKRR